MKGLRRLEGLGARLRGRREALGWSQRELGRRVGCSNVTISAFERDRCSPSYARLVLLCNALGVSADHLLGMDGSGTERRAAS